MKMNWKNIILIFILIIFLVSFLYIYQKKEEPRIQGDEYEIVLHEEEGYIPDDITIYIGDTITFKTTQGSFFWPASDLHPSHDIYPEFDPKDVIFPEESWNFQFLREGEWKYHDHLAPYHRGIIRVLPREENINMSL